jgi:serine phosphatase RsbU (regulator of sigma subunit)/anti-sigma regulatory factor (Ser/Thr protein kinase)
LQVDYRRIRSALPEGRTLPEELWTRRHRGILVLLWAHAALIPVFALVRGFSLGHTILEAAIVPLAALLATTPALSRRQRSAAASIGLLSCSAVLVHLSGGVIEMHFHFFVMVAVVALYQDWICFLTAIGYVLVHHGVLGAVEPSSVFNHYAALNHPWKWAAIHAFFITSISVACLVTWRLDEDLLDREREAEERLREETRIVETLNDVGRTVAAELDLRAVVQRVTDAATDLTAAAFGAFFHNVVDARGESYMLYALSGVPAESFAGYPMPRNTEVFGPTFAGDGTVRLDDVTVDPRYGRNPPHHGLPEGHLPVRSYLAVPVRSARGEVLGGLFFGHPEPARFTDVDERLAEGIAAHAAVAIDNARLFEAQRQSRELAERAQGRLALLADASRVLASSLDVDPILGELTAMVVPTMADECVVFLAGDDGRLCPLGADPDERPVAVADTASPVARSFGTGQSILLGPPTGEPATTNGAGPDRPPEGPSSIVVPLAGREGPVGVIALRSSAGSNRVLTLDDAALVEELGRRAAVAVEHARLYASQRSAAETLQRSLLPEVLPEIPGVEIASRYLPGGPDVDVGGDWYDVLALPDGRLALVMGDVVGRGVPAASLMGQLRNGLRAYIVEGRSPSQVLVLLNRLLRDVGTTHQMATLVVMVLDPETGELRYANAGHPPPLVENDGLTQFLEDAVGVPLGAIGHAEYSEAAYGLTPGSTLILYTDGLVEDRSMPLDVGFDRLRASLRTGPDDLDAMCEHLAACVSGAESAQDDVAILAVRWLALGAALDLRVPSQQRVLRPLRGTLRRWLAGAGVTDHEAYEILVAASEACSNAIRHGAPQATHFDLKAELDGDVAIVVRSSGRWRERRSSAPGGRGLDIIRQFMDETEVDAGEDTTEIRMRRRLDQSLAVPGAGVDAG